MTSAASSATRFRIRSHSWPGAFVHWRVPELKDLVPSCRTKLRSQELNDLLSFQLVGRPAAAQPALPPACMQALGAEK